jgi:predicted DNA-binding transcriptional regulator YafY
MPGLWFSAEEIHALLTMQHLLTHLDAGGLLGPHIQPLLARLHTMLESGDEPANHIQQRVRILAMRARDFQIRHFQRTGSALLKRKRLRIEYEARGNSETSQRDISPQRLIHYRDNWYLGAWCHLREGLSSFSMDAILEAEEIGVEAIEIPSEVLDAALSKGYGIFSGETVAWATLQFSPERARWVAKEHWHPQQKGEWLADGGYELKIPYSRDPELIMDILKHGHHCTVIGPPALLDRVMEELHANLSLYAAL